MKTTAHVLVTGRVQGVFFRVETRNRARKQNVCGWVRNLSDGRVEALFEGEKEGVEKVVDFCRTGPPMAKVSRVVVEWQDYVGEFTSFGIRSTSRI